MKEKDNPQNGERKVFSNGDKRNSPPKQANRARAAQKKKKNKQPNRKMGPRSKWTFVQRRHPGGHKAPEKMFSVPNH